MNLTSDQIDRLRDIAKREALRDDEDLTVYDYPGSNVDDAYERGLLDGETELARDLLNELGVVW